MNQSRGNVPDVVVITGATAGVGRAVARRFAADGAKIGVLARGQDGLEATVREIENLGGTAIAIKTDVADYDQVESAAEKVEKELGAIDIWINNAMTSVFAPVREIEPDEFRRVTEVTYLGTVWGTMVALDRMMPRNHGKIVQVGSALAYRGIPLQAAYCGAKHGIQGFNDSVYTELLHEKSDVRLTQVNLPAVNTPQFGWVRSKLPKKAQPVPPIFQPEVIAEAIHWAAYHNRRELTVGFSALKAIWGNKIVPTVADHYLARTGFDSQQTDEPEDRGRADNLFEPIAGDHGAHGSFDERSKDQSLSLLINQNREWIAGAIGIVALLALLKRR